MVPESHKGVLGASTPSLDQNQLHFYVWSSADQKHTRLCLGCVLITLGVSPWKYHFLILHSSLDIFFSSTLLLYQTLLIFIIILEQLEILVIKLLQSACVE